MNYNYITVGDIKVSVTPFDIFNNGKDLDKTCKHEELTVSDYTIFGGTLVWVCKKCGASFKANFERNPSIKLK